METVKSQRGAKSVAQYGMAHQNALELMKTIVINAFAAQNCKDLNFRCKVCVEKQSTSGWSDSHQYQLQCGGAPTKQMC